MKFIFEKENFIDLDICKKLIKYQKDNCPKNEPKGFWTNRIVTDYDIKIKKLIEPIHNKILRLIKKFYKEKNIYLEFTNLVYWGPNMELGAHADNVWIDRPNDPHYTSHRDFSSVLYLNDNFKGGETYFPKLDHIIKPKTGKLTFFPSGSTHIHGVKKIIEGNRFTLATWFTKDKRYSIQ
jgi:hypothetical protein